eukprot:CAMPEP_0174339434 /NCGR_PEP_ID=MMETSP0810-20121108/23900_1 /TAXON_ID=73025 ORGANISM="Eutreptiella gymnastica-like, Strain CCMP1594" /NCGR_SAMPLE_ID=MMETSP0810 /ASSEMBLY_ACC=CAM_ASM_000659 /LENGTH=85 /DNA_ID=CAMNT_0015460051 /DNA_START=22 /DNA_END=275 /DNA_ORIENTATION=+
MASLGWHVLTSTAFPSIMCWGWARAMAASWSEENTTNANPRDTPSRRMTSQPTTLPKFAKYAPSESSVELRASPPTNTLALGECG